MPPDPKQSGYTFEGLSNVLVQRDSAASVLRRTFHLFRSIRYKWRQLRYGEAQKSAGQAWEQLS
jgi:hypothetical protein